MIVSINSKHIAESGVVFRGNGLSIGSGDYEHFEKGLAGSQGVEWGVGGGSFGFLGSDGGSGKVLGGD